MLYGSLVSFGVAAALLFIAAAMGTAFHRLVSAGELVGLCDEMAPRDATVREDRCKATAPLLARGARRTSGDCSDGEDESAAAPLAEDSPVK